MAPRSNTTVTNLVIAATLSSSVIFLPYSADEDIPENNYNSNTDIHTMDWREEAFNTTSEYSIGNESLNREQAIIDFANKISENTKDIDSEFVDIVNDNFWDLV